MRGSAINSAPTLPTIIAAAVMASAGDPRNPRSISEFFEQIEFGDNFLKGQVRRRQAHILEYFRLHATKTDQYKRSPIGIVVSSDDELQPHCAHAFNEPALRPTTGPRADGTPAVIYALPRVGRSFRSSCIPSG